MDENVWENPHVFQPERFLDSSGNVINSEKLMSFGTGKLIDQGCLTKSIQSQLLM